MKLFDLSNKIAVITGGTRGIGRGIALGMADHGADVLIIARTMKEEVLEEIRAKGVRAWGIAWDLGKVDTLDALVKKVLETTGRVDILVNNAGLILRHPADQFPDQAWKDVLDINLTASYILCQRFGVKMLEQGSGKIINIGSLLSFQGGINVVSYAASKGGVLTMTKALANEWISRGVNVNCIVPGYISTELSSGVVNDPVRRKQLFERIPAQRFGEPEDLAGPAVFLASKAADYISGESIAVDGGWLAR